MRLLNSRSALLLPAIASTHVLANTSPATVSASPNLIPEPSLAPAGSHLVAYWSPISTIYPSPSDAAHLDLRQVQVATADIATVAGQVSPVTTIQENYRVNGVMKQVEVVYTQTFAPVPDQGVAPGVGSIGLGTIQGEIGVVKTKKKRDEMPMATAMAEVERREALVERELENGGLAVRDVEEQAVKRRSSTSLAGKVDATSAGSALALLVAITAMIVV